MGDIVAVISEQCIFCLTLLMPLWSGLRHLMFRRCQLVLDFVIRALLKSCLSSTFSVCQCQCRGGQVRGMFSSDAASLLLARVSAPCDPLLCRVPDAAALWRCSLHTAQIYVFRMAVAQR